MSGVEGIGELVTGGMAARAVEPRTGAAEPSDHSGNCLNCGAVLAGDYCHDCGQAAHVHHSLGAFWHDLLHGVLHLEGKTWRTLPMLAWRPGELTRRYIDGERARFVSPMALFLFSVFLMFAVFSTIGAPIPTTASAEIQSGLTEQAGRAGRIVAETERKRAIEAAAGRPVQTIDAGLARVRADAEMLSQIERDGLLRGIAARIADDLPEGFIRSGVAKFNENPTLALYKLQTNAYKFSWLLIPLSVPLLSLLFLWRRQHWRAYDHTVFITYSLSAQLLMVVIASVLARIGVPFGMLVTALSLYISMHVYWQFRGTYGLSRFSAFWRMMVLTIVAGVALVLFALLMLAIGATG